MVRSGRAFTTTPPLWAAPAATRTRWLALVVLASSVQRGANLCVRGPLRARRIVPARSGASVAMSAAAEAAPSIAARASGRALQVGRTEVQTLVFEGDYVVHYERGVCQYAGRLREGAEAGEDGEAGEAEVDAAAAAAAEAALPILLRFADRTVALEAREARRLTRER